MVEAKHSWVPHMKFMSDIIYHMQRCHKDVRQIKTAVRKHSQMAIRIYNKTVTPVIATVYV